MALTLCRLGLAAPRHCRHDPDACIRACACAAASAESGAPARPDCCSHSCPPASFETALLHALELEQFTLCYQPRLDLKTLQIKGVKALLRWKHPERGLAMPLEFLSVLEQSAPTLPHSARMLAGAAAQVRQWAELGRPLTVSVSLSPQRFYPPHAAQRFAAILQASGVAGRFIELEISAHLMLGRNEDCDAVLQWLRHLGIGICIGEIDRGGAVLNCLKRYPADLVKIEKIFVDETRHSEGSRPRTVRALDMQAIACGVESGAQLARLGALDCDEAFGFCLSRPVVRAEIEALLENWVGRGLPPACD